MAIFRVPVASLLLAAAFTSITSAQTTFSPQYSAFSKQPTFNEPPPLQLFQADLNRDSIPDFIPSQGKELLLSLGGGKYAVHQFSSPNASLCCGLPIAAGDFNGDGKNDVVFTPGGGDVFVAYGDGTGDFPTGKSLPTLPGVSTSDTGQSYVIVQTADVNGDGRPDLILAYIADGIPSITFNVRLYLNNGSGFTDKGNIYSYPLAPGVQPGVPWDFTAALDLLLGDYDADGHADVAVRFLSYNGTTGDQDGNLVVLYGDGAGHFTPKSVYSHRATELVLSAADMNDDGRTDLVGADVGQTIHIFRSNPGRTFSESVISAPSMQQSYYNYPPMLADFDGNGLKDIGFVGQGIAPPVGGNIVSNGLAVAYQTSANTWKLGPLTPVDTFEGYHGEMPFTALYVGNYNQDGKSDVVFFTDDGTAQAHPNSADVLLNTGGKSAGNCPPPAIGIHVCTPGASSASPVKFSFSATSFYPLRKMEVWVDGVKKSETFHVFANQGFSDVSLTLAAGTHTVSFFAGTFDGGVTKKTISLKVP